jgi:hypothetical protein
VVEVGLDQRRPPRGGVRVYDGNAAVRAEIREALRDALLDLLWRLRRFFKAQQEASRVFLYFG